MLPRAKKKNSSLRELSHETQMTRDTPSRVIPHKAALSKSTCVRAAARPGRERERDTLGGRETAAEPEHRHRRLLGIAGGEE